MKNDVLDKLEAVAKKEREYFYDQCTPVTNDSYVCMLEEAAREIRKLRKRLQRK